MAAEKNDTFREGAWIEIRRDSTGEIRWYRDKLFSNDPEMFCAYGYTDGNYACNSNRALFFALAGGEKTYEPHANEEEYTCFRALCDDGRIIELDDEKEDKSSIELPDASGKPKSFAEAWDIFFKAGNLGQFNQNEIESARLSFYAGACAAVQVFPVEYSQDAEILIQEIGVETGLVRPKLTVKD